jgi:hypothetical protein
MKLGQFHADRQGDAGQDRHNQPRDPAGPLRQQDEQAKAERCVQQDVRQQVSARVPVPPRRDQVCDRPIVVDVLVEYERIQRPVDDERRQDQDDAQKRTLSSRPRPLAGNVGPLGRINL